MANDYGSLGYDKYLNATDSLASKPIEQQNPLYTETIIERGAITSTQVDSSVGSIADLSITTAKLADGAVITSKFGTNSVDSTILQDLAVTAGKLAGSAVVYGKIGTGAVGSVELQNACIGSANIGNAAVGSLHVQNAAIGAAAIANAAIGSAAIGTGVIQNVHIGTAAILDANVGTISFNKIQGGTAILGGTNNVSGLLEVYDNSGSTLVAKIGNTGIVSLSQSVRFGTPSGDQALIGFDTSAPARLQIESLGYNIRLETDDGTIQLNANGKDVEVTVGTSTGQCFRVKTSAGTIMELLSNGNLNIAGALGTGATF